MHLRFLKSTVPDIVWMRRYYQSVFPEGSRNARKNYEAAKIALKSNPYLGHPVETMDGVREYLIPRTPFCFIYRIADGFIVVLRVLDKRSDGPIGKE